MFGHIYSPPDDIPPVSSLLSFKKTERVPEFFAGVQIPRAELSLENTIYPVSRITRLPVESLNLGLIYPGQFDRFLVHGNPSHNRIISYGIPVITKQPVHLLTEKIVDFNLTLIKIPYEVMGSLLHISKDVYHKLEKTGKTIFLWTICQRIS